MTADVYFLQHVKNHYFFRKRIRIKPFRSRKAGRAASRFRFGCFTCNFAPILYNTI